MINFKVIRENLSQILAITEKNIKLRLRYKFTLVISYITTIISILTPLILMGNIFQFRNELGIGGIGSWTSNNFILYQFMAYNIMLLTGITNYFPGQLRNEKFWKTLPALIVCPFNRLNLLFGSFFSQLVLIFIPFVIFFVLGYIFIPVSLITIISVLILYFIIALIFSGIGIIFGVFAISNENIWKVLNFLLVFVFWFSCITYPFEIFPEFIQNIISLNPFYYIFDFLRLTWIQDMGLNLIVSFPLHFIVLISSTILFPIVGVFLFNYIYKKFGIKGY